jgi:gliding motility-associated protein GldM
MFENGQQKGTSRMLRHKVVNLLYLIFIVMAFLYIPADFIDVFRSINQDYEEAVDDFSSSEYDNFNHIMFNYLIKNNNDSLSYLNNLKAVKRSSTEIVNIIESYKKRLIEICGGNNEFDYLTDGKNYSYTHKLLIEEKLADSIRHFITLHEKLIRPLVDQKTFFKVDSLIDNGSYIVSSTGKWIKWEKYYFNKMPISGAVAIMSKFEDDLKKADNIVLESYINSLMKEKDLNSSELLKEILIGSLDTLFPDNVLANQDVIITSKDFYKLGDEIELGITLPVKDFSKINAFVLKGDRLDSLKINEEGIGRFFPYEKGNYKFIIFVENRIIEKFVQVEEIKPIIESPDQNVLYTGIENVVKIYHEKYSGNKLKVKVNRGELKYENSECKIKFKSKGLAIINVYGLDEKSEKLLAVKKYQVKDIPLPKILFFSKQSGEISKNELINQKHLSLSETLGNENIFKIKEFEIKRIRKNNDSNSFEIYINSGEKFDKQSKTIFENTENGDILIFGNIQVESLYGRISVLPSIIFNII